MVCGGREFQIPPAQRPDGARVAPFISHHLRYDDWFERHRAAYLSELLALRALLPWNGRGLEIGVGTGRFAAPLGIELGIDPAAEMLGYARKRGIRVARAVAESLPFVRSAFDYALIMTTICFVDDARVMLQEVARVLRPGGTIVIGLIDRESPLGQYYIAHQAENVFYRNARFFTALEVEALLTETGFGDLTWVQTLEGPLSEVGEIEPVRAGKGNGAFLAVRGRVRSLAEGAAHGKA
jgi:SAM-dependent methyltransferase